MQRWQLPDLRRHVPFHPTTPPMNENTTGIPYEEAMAEFRIQMGNLNAWCEFKYGLHVSVQSQSRLPAPLALRRVCAESVVHLEAAREAKVLDSRYQERARLPPYFAESAKAFGLYSDID
jgi:hypothetical protein